MKGSAVNRKLALALLNELMFIHCTVNLKELKVYEELRNKQTKIMINPRICCSVGFISIYS